MGGWFPYNIGLHCTRLHGTTLQCTTLHCIKILRTAMHLTALHYTVSRLHCNTWHHNSVHCTLVHTTLNEWRTPVQLGKKHNTAHSFKRPQWCNFQSTSGGYRVVNPLTATICVLGLIQFIPCYIRSAMDGYPLKIEGFLLVLQFTLWTCHWIQFWMQDKCRRHFHPKPNLPLTS